MRRPLVQTTFNGKIHLWRHRHNGASDGLVEFFIVVLPFLAIFWYIDAAWGMNTWPPVRI
jgi:hypothetical protein